LKLGKSVSHRAIRAVLTCPTGAFWRQVCGYAEGALFTQPAQLELGKSVSEGVVPAVLTCFAGAFWRQVCGYAEGALLNNQVCYY
jgi:membrane protein DedA with SNARE-associated domain